LTSLAPSAFLSDTYDERPWRVGERVSMSIRMKLFILILLQELRERLARVKDTG